ncbi:hypothetical protein [Caldimonas brevitalea]|nr:hypothetical protein [Caldimonas brevitalea]
MTVVLAACGGGGGGGGSGGADSSPETYPDGMGRSGLAAGTVEIGEVANYGNLLFDPALALMDNGQALAAWIPHRRDAPEDMVAWSLSDTQGSWSSQRVLPQSVGVDGLRGLRLRVNSSGDAVLGWATHIPFLDETRASSRALRFTSGSGDWEGSAVEIAFRRHAETSDLDILPDGAVVTSRRVSDAQTKMQAVEAHTRVAGSPTPTSIGRVPRLSSEQMLEETYFATGSGSEGKLLWLSRRSNDVTYFELRGAKVSLEQGVDEPYLITSYRALCGLDDTDVNVDTPTALARTWTVASSPTSHTTVAMLAPGAESEIDRCPALALHLIRINDSADRKIESAQMTPSDGFIPVPPALVMDGHGNALAVWKEADLLQPLAPARLKWSVSRQGGEWTAPKEVIPNLASIGTVVSRGSIALAMNSEGQAVAAVIAQDGNSKETNELVIYGRFDFNNGWSEWKKAANKTRLWGPKVAINRSGAAMLVYTAYDLDRENGKARTTWNSDMPVSRRIYALRF